MLIITGVLVGVALGYVLTSKLKNDWWENKIEEEKIIVIGDKFYKTTEVNVKMIYSEVQK